MAHPVPLGPASRDRLPLVLVILLSALYGGFFGWLSLRRYWAYEMHALDMGNMSQAAWNTIHGHPFRFTNMRLPYAIEAWNTTTRLSFHVEPLFPVISLVYLIYPHPESLLIEQTAVLALGALPVYLLARNVLGNAWLGSMFALTYLLFPSLQAMNLYEFHPVALATPLLLWAFFFAWQRRYMPFVLLSVAAMGTKEQIGLVVAMFGLYVALVQKHRRIGFGMAIIGVAWSLFAALIVEHHFRQPGTQTYLSTRYGYLGHGVRGLIHTLTHDPGVLPRTVFTWPKVAYVERLLAPVGFLALFSLPALVLGVPTFALNVLSTNLHMYSGLGDNSAELIVVVLIAAILGCAPLLSLLRLWLAPRRALWALGIYLGLTALWSQHEYGFTPIGASFQIPVVGSHQQLTDRFVDMVPPLAPVSTQDQLDPHLSSRAGLYLFRDTGREPPLVPADYLLLDVGAPTYPLTSTELQGHAAALIQRGGWGIVAAEDGLILLHRGAHERTIPPSFYGFALAGAGLPDTRLGVRTSGIDLLGYDITHSDLPNHAVPNLNYTFYLRPVRSSRLNLQPVVFEVVNGSEIGCARDPLGLAWFPTRSWRPGQVYTVRMNPLETTWQTPGTATLYVGLHPVITDPQISCRQLWSHHGRLWSVGSLRLAF